MAAWEEREVKGKGRGLFATRDMQRGEVVFRETPVLEVGDGDDAELLLAFDNLSNEQQQAVLRLEDSWCERTDSGEEGGMRNKTLLGIMNTNAYGRHLSTFGPDEGPRTEGGVLLLQYSRANHSCRPNVVLGHNINDAGVDDGISTSSPISSYHLYATRDIAADEELCTTYINPAQQRDSRQRELLSKYRFHCRCEVCELRGAALEQSDRRRRAIQDFDDPALWNGFLLQNDPPTDGKQEQDDLTTAPARAARTALAMVGEEFALHCAEGIDLPEYLVLLASKGVVFACMLGGTDGAPLEAELEAVVWAERMIEAAKMAAGGAESARDVLVGKALRGKLGGFCTIGGSEAVLEVRKVLAGLH